MVESREGFYVPKVDLDLCLSCNVCEKSCPQLNLSSDYNEPVSVLAAWSTDEHSRRKSASGAAFFEIAKRFVETGGVVFGAINDNGLIRHCSARTPEELDRMRGSKYVQSYLGDSFKEAQSLLKQGTKVLFSGTPCQIAGLKSYIGSGDNKLFLLDLVCHGVPPARYFKHYISYLSKKYGQVSSYDYQFRNAEGWDETPYLQSKEGRLVLKGKDASYMNFFLKSSIFNECCYDCHYARIPRVGDLSLGDFWGIGKSVPFNEDISNGCSLILVNTEKGKALINETGSRLFSTCRTLDEALVVNTNLRSPCPRPFWRSIVIRLIDNNRITSAYLLFIAIPGFFSKVYWKIHHALHIIKIRICQK